MHSPGPIRIQLKAGHRTALLDFERMMITTENQKIELSGINNQNGIDVAIRIGQASGMETIQMQSVDGWKLVYRHSGS